MGGSAHLLSPCSHLRSLSFALRLPRTAAFSPSAVSFSQLRTTCVVSKRRMRSTITISGYQIACNTMLRVGNRAVARYRTCRRLVSLPRSADALAERVRAYNERSSRKSWAEQQLEDRHAPLIARARSKNGMRCAGCTPARVRSRRARIWISVVVACHAHTTFLTIRLLSVMQRCLQARPATPHSFARHAAACAARHLAISSPSSIVECHTLRRGTPLSVASSQCARARVRA
jgi:hypothetical protein